MLNPILCKQFLHQEIALLYKNKTKITNRDIFYAVQQAVREIKLKTNGRYSPTDLLEGKLQGYGNEGGWYHQKVNELNALLFRNKQVSNEFVGEWRSIEFELILNDSYSEHRLLQFVRAENLRNFVTIKGDGSVTKNDDDEDGIEKEIVLTYRKGEEDKVVKLCKFLQKNGYVNKSCGTHVHFDMRHVNSKMVGLYGRRIARCVEALKKILPPSRANNHYCAKDINTFDKGARYAFVNLQSFNKYRTLEVRGHSGTIDATKILNWIQLCESVMSKRIRTKDKKISDLNQVYSLYKLDKDLVSYMEHRNKALYPVNEPISPQPAPSGASSVDANGDYAFRLLNGLNLMGNTITYDPNGQYVSSVVQEIE